MNRITGTLLVLFSMVLSLVGLATLIAMFRAMTVESTFPAVESAFGSLVIAVGLLVLARLAFRAGIVRVRHKNRPKQE